MMKTRFKILASALAIAFAAQTVSAWSLFGISSSNAAGRLKSADALLEKADMAFEAGDYATASSNYERALSKYNVIDRDYPEFNDGISTIRIEYCEAQIAQCSMALTGDSVPTAEPQAVAAPAQPSASVPATTPAPATAMPTVAKPAAAKPVTLEAQSISEAAAAFRNATGESQPPPQAKAAEVEPSADAPYNPRYLAFDFGEARELIERGRHADAAEILIPMVKADPENRQFRMLLAAARLGSGHPELAITALEDLRGRREDLPLLLLLAAAYTSAGRYPDALLALDTAVRLAPGEPDAFSNLAWLALIMDGNTPEARTNAEGYYQQALRRGAARDITLEAAIGVK
ncbi:MAG: tetratricopeptide repeat protein [Kiritimatiellae bacterium]|nr:tetratricopeptide repeat protein [Kiritimatiellia bacterium]